MNEELNFKTTVKFDVIKPFVTVKMIDEQLQMENTDMSVVIDEQLCRLLSVLVVRNTFTERRIL